ncbi:hypothetical protein COB28_03385 [Candidatus Dependentiae bacterium]|nr:MAG: hypothetical protein COB28_03385 [Candidatus Dependentiae bacterium]
MNKLFILFFLLSSFKIQAAFDNIFEFEMNNSITEIFYFYLHNNSLLVFSDNNKSIDIKIPCDMKEEICTYQYDDKLSFEIIIGVLSRYLPVYQDSTMLPLERYKDLCPQLFGDYNESVIPKSFSYRFTFEIINDFKTFRLYYYNNSNEFVDLMLQKESSKELKGLFYNKNFSKDFCLENIVIILLKYSSKKDLIKFFKKANHLVIPSILTDK